ncbi:M20/M25/M40 family metallo-hydrolase, partial [Halorussus amylolyticus]|uniref:M20/M25/M40 family metallo-hydrolase n=1 Tax=Halorussus amylolyticus TaxID=1126242 RepID=UPI00138F7807
MSASAIETDETARDLLVDLVSIPSVSGDERECAERLAAFFEDAGREVWIDEAGNVRAPADDSVLLTSHIDTVPGEIPVEVKDGELWGRGSVDATGPLAAMAVAAVRTGVSFVGVVGEETDSRGARFLVSDRDAPDAVVNGEPSGWDGVTLGYRGFLGGEYSVATDSAHTSRPDPNAIQQAMAWWSRVESGGGAGAPPPPRGGPGTAQPRDGLWGAA